MGLILETRSREGGRRGQLVPAVAWADPSQCSWVPVPSQVHTGLLVPHRLS